MRRAGALLVALGLLVLAVVGAAPAGAQDDESPLAIREVDATDPAAVEVTFFYSGERDDLADLTVRENGELMEATPAVPLDDQQALGVVLVIDASKSMERGRPDRAGEGGRPRVRRRQGRHRPDRDRHLRREGDGRPGVHHRQGRAQRGDRRHRPRARDVAVRRHRAVGGPLPRLRPAAEHHRVLRRPGQHLQGEQGHGRGGGHRRRRHAVRDRRREPRLRLPRVDRRGDRRHGRRRRRSRRGRCALRRRPGDAPQAVRR